MVSTRRQAAAASASEDTSDVRQTADASTVVSSKRSAAPNPRRAAKRALDPVAEAVPPRRSRRRADSQDVAANDDEAATPTRAVETADSPFASSGDEGDGEAYSALLASIFAGLEGGDEDGGGDGEDGDDADASVAAASGEQGNKGAGAAGAAERSDGEGAESEGRELDAEGVLAWKPDISIPDPLTAVAAAAVGLRKEVGLAKRAVVPPRDPRKEARQAAKRRQDTTGPGWFEMRAAPVTDQVKQDWRLLRLRAAYNPRHFYKSFDSTKIPKYFQIGELVEGAGEFYSGRLTKRERKQTFAEELLADIALKRERQKRYSKLQEEATKWSKHRKKNHPKIKRSAHRPKH